MRRHDRVRVLKILHVVSTVQSLEPAPRYVGFCFIRAVHIFMQIAGKL